MGGSTTFPTTTYMPGSQFGGYGGSMGGYGGGLGGFGGFGGFGGGYSPGYSQAGSGKGFQSMPPQRHQAQYAPMNFMPAQFARPQFFYPSIQGQMAGQMPTPMARPSYQFPAFQPPVSGGGKGFQPMPMNPGNQRQPMPTGPRPLPIGPPSPGGGPQPFMPGGRSPQRVEMGPPATTPAPAIAPAVPPREETEPRETIMPVTDHMYRGNKSEQMAQQSLVDYNPSPFPSPVDSRPPLTEEERMSGRYQLGGQGPIDMHALPADERAAMEKRWQEQNALGMQEATRGPLNSQAGSPGSLGQMLLSRALPVGYEEPARIQPSGSLANLSDGFNEP
jgi:hypothetical protein